MLHAWVVSTDGGGIAFYVCARLWLALFGHTEIAYRAFSSAGVFFSFAAMWFILKRYYQPLLALIPLVAVWFGNSNILWQMLQTRFYGMLLALVATATLLSLPEFWSSKKAKVVLVGCVNCLLTLTHPFGVVYSGLILAAAVISDRLQDRRRWSLYMATAVSWLPLLCTFPEIRNAARINRPWSWIPTPTFADLLGAYQPMSLFTIYSGFKVLLCVALATWLFRRERQENWQGVLKRLPLLMIATLLLTFPIVLWIASHGKSSYFVERYFCTYTFGIAILGAEVLNELFRAPFTLSKPVPLLLATGLLAFTINSAFRFAMLPFRDDLQYPGQDFTGPLLALVPKGESVLVPRTDVFDELAFYRSSENPDIFYPVDWPYALSSGSPRSAVSGEHEMENWRQVGYHSNQILDVDSFLRTHDHFVLIDGKTPLWLQFHLLQDPAWHTTKLATFDRGDFSSTVWQVTR